MSLNFKIEYIDNFETLQSSLSELDSSPAIALDIETINWWDREAERISLIQLAYRKDREMKVAIIDALAGFDLEPLRDPLELSLKIKAIHNASFDAIKLARYYGIAASPIHDTMLAARRSGEKHCSLKAQAEAHLGMTLDKNEQRSDWSRRPLSDNQLRYAALDAACTLTLFEKQLSRGLRGDYELRERIVAPPVPIQPASAKIAQLSNHINRSQLSHLELAMLGVVSELNGRFSPEQLAASVGSERIGLAGWIIDRALGTEVFIDQRTATRAIESLCEKNLILITFSRRLEATEQGAKLWRESKLA